MRVAIIGANGQLGADLCSAFSRANHDVLPILHGDMDISDLDAVLATLSGLNPDLAVNTAAMHHLPRCEEEPEKAFAVNTLGARNLALFSRDRDVPVIHVSTDYVFDGAKKAPYVETDPPRPLNVYGETKLAGEKFVQSIAERYFIVRTSGLYGTHPCRAKGHNFVDLMLRLARERGQVDVVDDEVLTPTSTEELAGQIVALGSTDAYGLYHATAEGSCSWYEFAARIFAVAGVEVTLNVAEPGRFASPVVRPDYSVLENRSLKARGLDVMRPWPEGLERYLSAPMAVAS